MFEGLERRDLLAVTIVNDSLASASTQINGMTVYPDGNIWFTGNSGELGVLNPAMKSPLEFGLGIPGSNPQGIAVGHDGDLYFTDPGTNSIGVFNPANLKRFEVAIPTKSSGPSSIAVANDGTIWFTETAVGKIGEYDPTTQNITEFPLATATSQPSYLQVGPGGKLWFEEFGGFGVIDLTTHMLETIPATAAKAPVGGFSFTPDGNVWYIVGGSQYAAARLVPSTGAITVFPASAPYGSGGPSPRQLATGADGNIYFAVTGGGPGTTVGEINVKTQKITSYSNGTNSDSENAIVSGLDGELFVGGLGVLGRATIIPPNVSAISGNVSVAAFPPGSGPTLEGRTVFVDLNGDGKLDAGDPATVSDANGNYTIDNVPIGAFNLRVILLPGDVVSPVPVATTGGEVTQNVAVYVQQSSAVLPFPLLANPFGAHNPSLAAAEVTGLYNLILRRAPDPTGLANGTSYLQNGGSLSALAGLLLHSTEYESDLIASYYETYFGRAGSPAEIAAWVSLMQTRESAEQVTYLMLTSPEFTALHPDNASFIKAVFADLLGRVPSAGELASWESYTGGASRGATVYFMIHSPEAGVHAARGFYAQFWASPMTQAGAAAVVSALEFRNDLADVAAQFAGAPQFVARAQASVG